VPWHGWVGWKIVVLDLPPFVFETMNSSLAIFRHGTVE